MFKKCFMTKEKGQILPLVLVALVVGMVVMLPSLRYINTHLKTGQVLEENIQGLYAADAGVEAALKWVMNDWYGQSLGTSPYYWTNSLTENGMTVNVTVNAISSILGGKVASKANNPPDQHTEWCVVDTRVEWQTAAAGSPGPYLYTFTMNITNIASLTMQIDQVWIGIQDGITFKPGSSSFNLTPTPLVLNPTITGGGAQPILLMWKDPDNKNPQPIFKIDDKQGNRVQLVFQVWGPVPDPKLQSGIIFYDAVMPGQASIGSIIVNNQYSYFLVTSTAWNQKGEQAKIMSHVVAANLLTNGNITGVSKIKIMDWQIEP